MGEAFVKGSEEQSLDPALGQPIVWLESGATGNQTRFNKKDAQHLEKPGKGAKSSDLRLVCVRVVLSFGRDENKAMTLMPRCTTNLVSPSLHQPQVRLTWRGCLQVPVCGVHSRPMKSEF